MDKKRQKIWIIPDYVGAVWTYTTQYSMTERPLRLTSAEYQYEGGDFQVTDKMLKDYDNYGYIMIRNLLDSEELQRVKQVLEDNQEITKRAFGVADGTGRESRMALWSHPGNDVTGMVARCEKLVNTCEAILRDEVYHYHTKLMMKNPYTGGSHLWHQDYGYWYKNGCLFPDMMTVFIAIDRCMEENGCLEILRGSQNCGRIEHMMVAGQTGADLERVKAIQNSGHCPLEYVEMNPGDALLFHCNLLHTSGPNNSEYRRWAFLCSYNTKTNNPVIEHHHPCYTPLHKVPNSAIKECENFTDMTGKEFMDPKTDKTIVVDKDTKEN